MLPHYIDIELWSAFVEQRQAMAIPFSQAAQRLVIKKLMRMHSEGWDVNASLEKSAIYGWKSVFEVSRIEVKKEPRAQQGYRAPNRAELDAMARLKAKA